MTSRAEEAEPRFPSWVRTQGTALFDPGAARLVRYEDDYTRFKVKDRPEAVDCSVSTRRPLTGPPGTCGCAKFRRVGECSHLWAAILELDLLDRAAAAAENDSWVEFDTERRPLWVGPKARKAAFRKLGHAAPTEQPTAAAVASRTVAPNRREEFELRLLDQFITTLKRPQPPVPAAFADTEIRFGLLPDQAIHDGCLLLHAVWRSKRSAQASWEPAEADAIERARLSPTDRRLLHRLEPFRRRDLDSRLGPHWRVALPTPALAGLAEDLFEQERVYWLDEADSPIPRWLPNAGVRTVTFRHHHQADRAILEVQVEGVSAPLGFLDGLLLTRDGLEAADCDGDAAQLAQYLATQGPLKVERTHEDRMLRSVTRLIDRGRLVSPDARLRTDVEPVPHALLHGAAWLAAPADGPTLRLQLGFDYDGVQVMADDPTDPLPNGATLIRRAPESEQAAIDLLLDAGAELPSGRTQLEGGLAISRAAAPELLRTMLDSGFVVEAERRRLRSASPSAISVRSGIDWFDVSAQLEVDAAGSFELRELLDRLEPGTNLVRLDDGTFGMLPEQWLRSFDALLAVGEAGESGQTRIQESQAWVIDWLLAEQATDAVAIDQQFAERRERLEKFRSVPTVREQKNFGATLREYQRQGLAYLEFWREHGLGGCLADDMGLGKTVQVLAMLDRLYRPTRRARGTRAPRGPALIVAPRSLVRHWLDEATRFAPRLHCVDFSGSGRWRDAERPTEDSPALPFKDCDVLVTTYGTVRRDATDLRHCSFGYVILDEAQAIKNASSLTAKSARLLQAEHRLALTGTPIENHLGELWSLFEFLNPGMLGRASAFQALLEQTKSRTADQQPMDQDMGPIQRALRPFLLRRTKDQVLTELPPKTEQVLDCTLGTAQREFYDSIKTKYRQQLLGGGKGIDVETQKMPVLEALLRLRQAACHPGLIAPKRSASAKFDVLLPLLEDLCADGHKALVFSQFTTLLGLLRRKLDANGLAYEYLDGKTRRRAERVERFQTDPDVPIFLISLKAGGTGLNLTAADYVFVLDPWWNPAVEAQAIDRAHRIGQARPVSAYRLIARDTVEEKILQLQESKRALASALFDGSKTLKDLTREDVEFLLS